MLLSSSTTDSEPCSLGTGSIAMGLYAAEWQSSNMQAGWVTEHILVTIVHIVSSSIHIHCGPSCCSSPFIFLSSGIHGLPEHKGQNGPSHHPHYWHWHWHWHSGSICDASSPFLAPLSSHKSESHHPCSRALYAWIRTLHSLLQLRLIYFHYNVYE